MGGVFDNFAEFGFDNAVFCGDGNCRFAWYLGEYCGLLSKRHSKKTEDPGGMGTICLGFDYETGFEYNKGEKQKAVRFTA